jgi:hypothetical protein
MNDALLSEMHALLAEAKGDQRVKASTTMAVAAIAMAKSVETLKAASKEFANSFSQLGSALNAAHEMTHEELKDFHKVLSRLDEVKDNLKKYILWAEENTKAVGKTADLLRDTPGPSRDPGPEPDPEKPFEQPYWKEPEKKPSGSSSFQWPDAKWPETPAAWKAPKTQLLMLPKKKPDMPHYSAKEWGLPTFLKTSKSATHELNTALSKSLAFIYSRMETLPASIPKPKMQHIVSTILLKSYDRVMAPALKKQKEADLEAHAFAQQKLADYARELLGEPDMKFPEAF